MTDRPLRRALISVSDKTGLIEFARALSGRGVEILSTGGTAKTLRDANLNVSEVSAVTGFPEMMDGRVKTLHPKIHGGLLALRDNPAHASAMREHGIGGIDLLVCNLYPFEATVAKGAAFGEVLENIDIGGPAMIRSAAKNHDWVAVIVDPEDYAALLSELEETGGSTRLATRRKLAQIAYSRTATYDAYVSNWFAAQIESDMPRRRSFAGHLRQKLRYGENPHQRAAFYVGGEKRPGVATAHQLQGKELSYNNIADTDAAFELAAEFDSKDPVCVIVKHANPCGVALGTSLADAYRKALACDSLSAFGGIVAFNRVLDVETAEELSKIFTEVIVAPAVLDEAKRILSAKKNLRLLVTGGLPDAHAPGLAFRSVAGGFLVQTRDNGRTDKSALKIVTKNKPNAAQLADMMFALTVAKHVKSNAIVYAKDLQTAGIGAGQMSRIDSARIAARKAEEAAKAAGWKEPLTRGSAAASEAFFPFADGLEAVVEAGATSVIQPGGSLRDEEVIEAADKAGIAMAFTGMRHFRH